MLIHEETLLIRGAFTVFRALKIPILESRFGSLAL